MFQKSFYEIYFAREIEVPKALKKKQMKIMYLIMKNMIMKIMIILTLQIILVIQI